MRTAELTDLKIGNELFDKYGLWTIVSYNEVDGWLIRGCSGVKILFEHQVKYYTVNE